MCVVYIQNNHGVRKEHSETLKFDSKNSRNETKGLKSKIKETSQKLEKQIDDNKERKDKKLENSRSLKTTNECSRKKRQNSRENIIKEIVQKYFPELEDMSLQMDRDHQMPSTMNKNETLNKLYHYEILENHR